MNYNPFHEEFPPVELGYFPGSPDRSGESWNFGAAGHNPTYYLHGHLEIDPTEQLVDGVSGISVCLPSPSISDVYPHPREEPYLPRGLEQYYKQGFPALNSYQESYPTQPYPYTSQTTTLRHRQPSPIETVSSSSSGFEHYSSYSRDSIASDLDSNGSPLPFSPRDYTFHHAGMHEIDTYSKNSCCALKEVQNVSDEDHEPSVRYINDHEYLNPDLAIKEEYVYPSPLSQANYEDKALIDETRYTLQPYKGSSKWASDDDEKDSDYIPSRAKPRRSSQSSTKPKQTLALARSKVTKRPASKAPQNRSATEKNHIQNTISSKIEPGTRVDASPFSCPLTPYGCKSTFKSKNEWKRHIVSRHLFLGFWRCDCCPESETRPNDFNRKDLFTEHLRRMHHPKKDLVAAGQVKISSKIKKQGAKAKNRKQSDNEAIDPMSEKFENSLEETRQRCWKHIRDSPDKAYCAFCEQIFDGQGSFDEWLEHVGQHLSEYARKNRANLQNIDSDWDSRKWMKDTILRDWLKAKGFLEEGSEDGKFRLVDDETAHEINMQQLQRNEES